MIRETILPFLALIAAGAATCMVHAQAVVLFPQNLPQEITIRRGQDKRVAPDAEQLAYAQRLYAADKYESVEEVTSQLLKDASPLASEAQFLRGKAMFALGKIEMTRQAYEWIVLRHPESNVVRDGRLMSTLSKAASYLLERHQWQDAGQYMALLQTLDDGEVARLRVSLVRQLDQELAEFKSRTEGRQLTATEESMRDLLQLGGSSCTGLTCYIEDDKRCRDSFDDTMAAYIRSLEKSRETEWQPRLEKWFGQRMKDFVHQLAAEAQSYSLLSQLATEAELISAISPSLPLGVSSPYSTRIENISGNRHRFTYDFNNSQYEGKRACMEIDAGRTAELGRQLSLRFAKLDREALLRRLGLLIGLDKPKLKSAGPKL